MQKVLQKDILLRQTRESAGKEESGVQLLRSEEEKDSTGKKILLTSLSVTYTDARSRRDTDPTPNASNPHQPQDQTQLRLQPPQPRRACQAEEELRGIALDEEPHIFANELWEDIFNDGARGFGYVNAVLLRA